MKKLLPSQIAKKYNVQTVTVRAWLNRGLFPNAEREETEFFFHPVWRIPESDLENFVIPPRGRPGKKIK